MRKNKQAKWAGRGWGGKAMEGKGEPPVLTPFPTPRSFTCVRSAYSPSTVTLREELVLISFHGPQMS